MIRPIDLQNTILQSMQSAAAVQRAEEGPRLAAQAAQLAFAAEVTHRDETVAPAHEVVGNKIGEKPERERGRDEAGDRQRKAAVTFEEVVDDAADSSGEAHHLIDFTA